MTKIQTRDKYMKLMNGIEIIESRYYKHATVSLPFGLPLDVSHANTQERQCIISNRRTSIYCISILCFISLHSHLVEHLNAEIVLHTISDVNMALDWIRSTFLYIRALKNPTHYGQSPKH